MPRGKKCTICIRYLHAYIEADLDGRDAAVRFPVVAEHLDSCPDCRAKYLELSVLFKAERRGDLLDPPFEPTFKFAFLEDSPGANTMWGVVKRKMLLLIARVLPNQSNDL